MFPLENTEKDNDFMSSPNAPILHTGQGSSIESSGSPGVDRSLGRPLSSVVERSVHIGEVASSTLAAATTSPVRRRMAFYAANPRHLQNVEQRFLPYVDKSAGSEACWPWTGGRRDGYGRFKLESYINVSAHRVAYLIGHGEDPGAKCVCHHCDNPPCCNPDHLFLGTTQDNTADMVAKGRHRTGDQRGENNGAAKLDAAAVEKVRELIRAGFTNTAIAVRFGVTHQAISRIRRGRSWGVEPMQVKYASLKARAA